jgi:hypothetical protein
MFLAARPLIIKFGVCGAIGDRENTRCAWTPSNQQRCRLLSLSASIRSNDAPFKIAIQDILVEDMVPANGSDLRKHPRKIGAHPKSRLKVDIRISKGLPITQVEIEVIAALLGDLDFADLDKYPA